MQELGHIAEMALDYAVENPVAAYFAVDSARYGTTSVAGDFKARFDHGSELMSSADLDKEINELERQMGNNFENEALDDLMSNLPDVAVESARRYIHSYRTGKLNRFKKLRENDPAAMTWKDSIDHLEPSDD